MRRLFFILVLLLWSVPALASDIQNTVHNLSTSGPGPFKSLTVDQVCVFCHTPHNASPLAPLWNRQMSGQVYLEYGSSTLDASPGQPTGQSRLCLACHDGTVALGALLNQPSGQTNDLLSTLLTGRGNLGTDLGDDHPISFLYDGGLAVKDQQLAHPAGIGLPLENNELQCTTCHEPHDNSLAPFLRKSVMNSQLCVTCHQKADGAWNWNNSSHATSSATASGGTSPWDDRKPEWRGTTVAQNGCLNCHTPHNAATPSWLLKSQEEATCYACHNGTVAATNIQSEATKPYRHPVETTPNPDHDSPLVEKPLTMNLHAECSDCHNPHGVKSALPMISFNPASPMNGQHTTAPAANAVIAGVPGIDSGGAVKANIDNQYELCFKCHGVPGKSACGTGRCSTATSFSMVRADGEYNIR